jgi:hypothetical protein
MIHVNKGTAPKELEEGKVKANKLIKAYEKIVNSTKKTKEKDKLKFFEDLTIESKDYAPKPVKQALYLAHFGKCAFCETRIIDSHYGDVEHYRPKKGVDWINNEGKKITIKEVYFWEAFNWNNFVLSCGLCNQFYKKNYFEILPDTQRLTVQTRDQKESPVLINPSIENPREFIRFDPLTAKAEANPVLLKQTPISINDQSSSFSSSQDTGLSYARAAKSIEVLGLNRAALVDARQKHLVLLHSLFLMTLNDRFSLAHIKELGEACANDENFRLQEDKIRDWLRKMPFEKPAAERSEIAEKAGHLIFLYLLPSGEYAGLSIDAICHWSIEEARKEMPVKGFMTTQSFDDKLKTLASGGEVNLHYRFPVSLLRTLTTQEKDYTEEVMKKYLDERYSLERDEDEYDERIRLYNQMNGLIARYKSLYGELDRFEKINWEKKKLTEFQDHADNYKFQLNRIISDLKSELKSTPSGPPLYPLPSDFKPKPELSSAVEENRKTTEALLEIIKEVSSKAEDFFDRVENLSYSKQIDKHIEGNIKRLDMAGIDLYLEKEAENYLDDDDQSKISILQWLQEYKTFYETCWKMLDKEQLKKVVRENYIDEFENLQIERLTLVYEANFSDAKPNAIIKPDKKNEAREVLLGRGIDQMLYSLENGLDIPDEIEIKRITIQKRKK